MLTLRSRRTGQGTFHGLPSWVEPRPDATPDEHHAGRVIGYFGETSMSLETKRNCRANGDLRGSAAQDLCQRDCIEINDHFTESGRAMVVPGTPLTDCGQSFNDR